MALSEDIRASVEGRRASYRANVASRASASTGENALKGVAPYAAKEKVDTKANNFTYAPVKPPLSLSDNTEDDKTLIAEGKIPLTLDEEIKQFRKNMVVGGLITQEEKDKYLPPKVDVGENVAAGKIGKQYKPQEGRLDEENKFKVEKGDITDYLFSLFLEGVNYTGNKATHAVAYLAYETVSYGYHKLKGDEKAKDDEKESIFSKLFKDDTVKFAKKVHKKQKEETKKNEVHKYIKNITGIMTAAAKGELDDCEDFKKLPEHLQEKFKKVDKSAFLKEENIKAFEEITISIAYQEELRNEFALDYASTEMLRGQLEDKKFKEDPKFDEKYEAKRLEGEKIYLLNLSKYNKDKTKGVEPKKLHTMSTEAYDVELKNLKEGSYNENDKKPSDNAKQKEIKETAKGVDLEKMTVKELAANVYRTEQQVKDAQDAAKEVAALEEQKREREAGKDGKLKPEIVVSAKEAALAAAAARIQGSR